MGWDGISANFFKGYVAILSPGIIYVCQLSLNSGCFLDVFKKAVTTPMFKSGDRNRVSDYRPISILSYLSKILEQIMNTWLTKYLKNHNILSAQQFGFRANKCTDAVVHELVSFIARNLDNKRKCLSIFYLAKAFDTVSIPLLLEKHHGVGTRGIALKWFESYSKIRAKEKNE